MNSAGKTNPKIFFFTGLGADSRAFQFLNLSVSYPQVHVFWLKPFKNESPEHYSSRLIEKYSIADGDLLIGLSFGGLIVTEISKQIKPALSILISSASTRNEFPLLYKIEAFLNLHRWVSTSFYKKGGAVKHFLFGLKKPEQRKLFDEIIRGSDTEFVRWAVDTFVHWKNTYRPNRLYKIHGTADRIIPIHKPSTDFIIPEAGHFMTWEKAKEVSSVINRLIAASVNS